MTIADYKEAFDILAEYEQDASPCPVYPEHEQILVHVDPNDIPEEDVERLKELGLHATFEHTEIPPHFFIFV